MPASVASLCDICLQCSVASLFDILQNCSPSIHHPAYNCATREGKTSITGAAGPLLDSLGESYGAGCEGSAFYALQSCCNHSCAPNAHAFKRAQIDTDGRATILARKPIAPGEEV